MRFSLLAGLIACASTFASAELNLSRPLSSYEILPANFKPPQVFKNVNLLRNINLEKSYVKETVNVVIENVDKAAQSEYFVPFEADVFGKIGGFEAFDKKASPKVQYKVDVVEFDSESPTQFIRVTLPEPLAPKAQQTLTINYQLLASLDPLPAAIEQQAKQYLQYSFSEYAASAYPVVKQKTKLKFPGVDVPDYTGKPERQGSTFTYGTFENIQAGVQSPAKVRYEFTKPVLHTTLLERDIEVSHWGGNVAFEDRYWLTNRAAKLAGQYNRIQWAQTLYQRQYGGQGTVAVADLTIPLPAGSANPYFTDEVGNVSTSKFRSGRSSALLELKPRYPVFGGWSFPFKIGYDNDASKFLKKIQGEGYVLQVPFLEGPKEKEGMSYERINLRIILPEGATYV